MREYKYLLYQLIWITLLGCASYEPKYKEPFEASAITSTKPIEKTFYLIGDAGYAKPEKSTPALLALEKYLAHNKQQGNYAIFLGDNIYPDGMPEKGASDRQIAEHRLNVQIESVQNFNGKIYFIPGNHDWYNEGLVGLKREEDYFEERLKDNNIFKPKTGCAFESIAVTDNIQLMLLDSQWYLEDWDKHPTINENCNKDIKTREDLLLTIEKEFIKHQHKTTVFVLHHPLYTNGVHGGKFAISKHLYPSQKKIPLPGLASLAQLIRTSGGVSSQDNMNKQYKKLVSNLTTLARAPSAGPIVFASGHEHSLQYIIHKGVKQIVSGAGAKNSYAALRNDGRFAYGGQGFARLDIYKDGSSQVAFYGAKNGSPELLFVTEVFPEKEKVMLDSLPAISSSYKETSIYNQDQQTVTEFHRDMWGESYRSLYNTKIKAEVANLDTLFGGLRAIQKESDLQTKVLYLEDESNKGYYFKALNKKGTLLHPSSLLTEKYRSPSYRLLVSDKVVNGYSSSSHPYAFLAIPKLAEKLEILQPDLQLYYVPKQKQLKQYNSDFGDELYLVEHRLSNEDIDDGAWGRPYEILNTSAMYNQLRSDKKYSLDKSAYVKARLFDMLIGDWNRNTRNWNWAAYTKKDGAHVFRPIPLNRDQAFSNYDGAFFGSLRGLVGAAKQFQLYEDEIKDIKWLNIAALQLDRTLLHNTSQDIWVKQAGTIKEQLSDEIIEKAFEQLPKEVQVNATTKLMDHLKARRDNIVEIAKQYYSFAAKLGIITGTDHKDYIEVERKIDGSTRVAIYTVIDGKKADLIKEETYHNNDTKELWIYGLDDQDIFRIYGEAKKTIRVRVIGGKENDSYVVENGTKTTIYDYKTKPNRIIEKGSAKLKFTDDYHINVFDRDQRIFKSNRYLPHFGYNPDDGFKFGLTGTFTNYGFYRNPFTKRHQFSAMYNSATTGFNLGYQGEFAGLLGTYNVQIFGSYTNPEFTENFFGFGNETVNDQDRLGFDYNRVKISRIATSLGVVKRGRFGSYFNYKLMVEGVEVDLTNGRFLEESGIFGEQDRLFDRQWFTGVEATYGYESYDNKQNPSRGMRFNLTSGAKTNTNDIERSFGYIKPYLGFYNSITRNRKLVLRTAVDAHILVGRAYEFYQSAQLGGDNLLRGYRNQRFSGQTALAGSADLRYSFSTINTRFLPIQMGVFAGADSGRVWLKGAADANTWHSDYGGGFWVNSSDALQATFNLFSGKEDLRFSFSLLFKI
ncbi:metallophosphoesterase [Aquimarina brevivitae]|uniref:Calcineurin-like phosphoesterase family protein n=1 Tax=Aquimarina brevivitae TaxID=323412 RepID=A0A4Q7PHH9_9FLAO|nr:metallophosphoesterase [Aquimarina brevivitae]RZT00032.1 calcineurin-like phosphoesterase family protein [Aquimarina brevivitae]